MSARRLSAALALACALAPRARAEEARPAGGFDHRGHAERLREAGEETPPCARCHPPGRGARPAVPGHGACFGPCHGEAPRPRGLRARRSARPYRVDAERLPICRACHAAALLERLGEGTRERAGALYPPYERGADFEVRARHAAHESAPGECAACHAVPPAPGAAEGRSRRPPHARCAGCHDGEGGPAPAMDACGGCHAPRPAGGGAERFPIGGFTHRAHLRRLPGEERCTSCHAWESLRAGKERCRGCHDGGEAFSMVAPRCTRCHTAPAPRPREDRGVERFSHRRHRELGLEAGCRDCHRLGESGAPRSGATGHAACADAGCHREEFAERAPDVCTACHVGYEPWLELHADRPPPASTEFGARFSHRAHLGGEDPLVESPCESCHRLSSGSRELRLPRDHRACTGDGCHAPGGASNKNAGAKPPLAQCRGCHALGLLPRHVQARAAARWSVRERFAHAPHRREPGGSGGEVPCLFCHEGVPAADRLGAIPVPSKESCARCHDGGAAFKLTGHGCARCHGGARRP